MFLVDSALMVLERCPRRWSRFELPVVTIVSMVALMTVAAEVATVVLLEIQRCQRWAVCLHIRIMHLALEKELNE